VLQDLGGQQLYRRLLTLLALQIRQPVLGMRKGHLLDHGEHGLVLGRHPHRRAHKQRVLAELVAVLLHVFRDNADHSDAPGSRGEAAF